MKSAPSQPSQMPQNVGRLMGAFRPQGGTPQINSANPLAAMLMRLGGFNNQQGAQPTTQVYQDPPMPPQGNQFTQGAPWQSVMAQMRGWGRQ